MTSHTCTSKQCWIKHWLLSGEYTVLSVTVDVSRSLPTPVLDDFQHTIWRVEVWEISSCGDVMCYMINTQCPTKTLEVLPSKCLSKDWRLECSQASISTACLVYLAWYISLASVYVLSTWCHFTDHISQAFPSVFAYYKWLQCKDCRWQSVSFCNSLGTKLLTLKMEKPVMDL